MSIGTGGGLDSDVLESEVYTSDLEVSCPGNSLS